MLITTEAQVEIKRMAQDVISGVEQIAKVLEIFPQYQDDVVALRERVGRDLLLIYANEHGIPNTGDRIVELTNMVPEEQTMNHNWVLNLALVLGFSLKGEKLSKLPTKSGLSLDHPWRPFRARVVEGCFHRGFWQDSFTLHYVPPKSGEDI